MVTNQKNILIMVKEAIKARKALQNGKVSIVPKFGPKIKIELKNLLKNKPKWRKTILSWSIHIIRAIDSSNLGKASESNLRQARNQKHKAAPRAKAAAERSS